MSNWIRCQSISGQGDQLRPLQLAWLGDAVWELHQRLRHCQKTGRASTLHNAVVRQVCAEAQSEALRRLEPWLNQQERDLIRRSRNRSGRGSRNAKASSYRRATGFETMVGWLFLQDPVRLAQLLDRLELETTDGHSKDSLRS